MPFALVLNISYLFLLLEEYQQKLSTEKTTGKSYIKERKILPFQEFLSHQNQKLVTRVTSAQKKTSGNLLILSHA